MTPHENDKPHETELQPTSGWVAISLIAILLLAATICGNGDYTSQLEAERDQLRARVAQLELAAPIREACWQAFRNGDLP